MIPPERTAQTYGPGVTGASKSVLLELMATLRSYREALVLVGGWAPYFLLQQHQRPQDPFVHVGSIDIDIAVDPSKVDEAQYETIVGLLRDRGYRPAADRRGHPLPDCFERAVQSPINAKSYTIRVDFLTHLDDPRPGRHRHLPVQDGLMARKIHGCDAAFAHAETFDLSGTLPDGGTMTVPIRMADVVSCLTMKGIVLGERYREKDAYDIYAVVAHYAGGPSDAADAMRPHLAEPLVAESLSHIRQAFGRRDGNGPAWAAAFIVNPMFAAEHQRVVTDAHMVVDEFVRLVSRSPASSAAG